MSHIYILRRWTISMWVFWNGSIWYSMYKFKSLKEYIDVDTYLLWEFNVFISPIKNFIFESFHALSICTLKQYQVPSDNILFWVLSFSYYFNAFCSSTCKKYYLRFSKATSFCIPNVASKKFVMLQWFSCCWAGYGLLDFDLQLEKNRLGGCCAVAECRAVCP